MGYNMNGFSGFGNSPLKSKQTDEEFRAAANKQKNDAINALKQKALNAGKSNKEATELAIAEYTRNIKR
jgi:hypothetical protein